MADTIRILRVIEYTGPRDRVEDCVARSLHGEKRLPGGLVIRAATVGSYPEVLDSIQTKTCDACGHPEHLSACEFHYGYGSPLDGEQCECSARSDWKQFAHSEGTGNSKEQV